MGHLTDYEEAVGNIAKAQAAIRVSWAKNSRGLAWAWAERAIAHAQSAGIENARQLVKGGRWPDLERLAAALIVKESEGQKYRWASPLEWLLAKAGEWKIDELYNEFAVLAQKLDGDTIQELYEREMDEDGYFDPIKEGPTVRAVGVLRSGVRFIWRDTEYVKEDPHREPRYGFVNCRGPGLYEGDTGWRYVYPEEIVRVVREEE